MKLSITPYQGDKALLIKFMEDLQDYLVEMDPLKLRLRLPEYGAIYVNNLLDQISNHKGMIYLADSEGNPAGMIAGMIKPFTKKDEIEHVPVKQGLVMELMVNENYRGQNVGSMLMNKMEDYFKQKGCNIAHVKVFSPNQKAHDFYKKNGYEDRFVDMSKKLT